MTVDVITRAKDAKPKTPALAGQSKVALSKSWLAQVGQEFEQPYMQELRAFLRQELRQGKTIYPPGPEMFSALNLTSFEKTAIVILGQDPYHGPGQAHGLSFSVKPGVPLPPSLQNIFKELSTDLCVNNGEHGCLIPWAKQGVLLLNSVLSVLKGQAASHQGRGWERFTDAVIDRLNREREGLVFMLWGSHAQKKGGVIDSRRHLVLKSPHPSPLSAYRGFFGCKHFSRANQYLVTQGRNPINWQLPAVSELDPVSESLS